MPERTDAEWRALADRIAREVMKYEVKPYRGGWMYSVPSAVHAPTIMHALDWRPHNDVAQALIVLDAIVNRGFDVGLISHHNSRHKSWIVPTKCHGPWWEVSHQRRAKAICLTIEKWMEANC